MRSAPIPRFGKNIIYSNGDEVQTSDCCRVDHDNDNNNDKNSALPFLGGCSLLQNEQPPLAAIANKAAFPDFANTRRPQVGGETFDEVMVHKWGKLEEAMTMYNTALVFRLKTLDDDDPEIASNHSNIGLVYSQQGCRGEAIKYFEQALAIQ